MHTNLDCYPCFARQALEAARYASDDETVQGRVMREALADLAAGFDLEQSPPQIGRRIHRLVRRLSGDGDPYTALKQRSTSSALAALPRLRPLVESAADPLAAAVSLAIAANVLDAGMNAAVMDGELDEGAPDAPGDAGPHAGDGVVRALERGLHEPVLGDIEQFRRAVASAGRILFLADNAGEIVVDRLLLELLPRDRLTIAVRGMPVLNDATVDDARSAGLDALAPVIGNGSDAPGTILSDCSPRFVRAFAEADLIIAKGQGNYESLSDSGGHIFFLFKVKCPLVARHTGLPLGAHALRRGR